MSLEQSNPKIRDVVNNEIENSDSLNKKELNQSIIRAKINRFNISTNIVKKTQTLYESSWVDTILSKPIVESSDTGSYIEWRISIPNMPIKFIPFINVAIYHNYVDGQDINIDANLIFGQYRYGHIFQVSDIVDNVAKNVVLIAGVSVGTVGWSVISQQFKLKVTLSNPEQFI